MTTKQHTARRIPPIPRFTHAHGPVTRTRLRRIRVGFAAIWAAALLALLLDVSDAVNAFALGLLVPGGGFVLVDHPVPAVVALLAAPVAVFLWWFLGMVLLLPGVWIGSAALAAALTGGSTWPPAVWVVPVVWAALVVFGVGLQRYLFAMSARRGRAVNERLADVELPVRTPPSVPEVQESSEEDLAVLRHVLDLSLQPLDEWEGFESLDQFRESALRYQLNFISYALAMHQYTRTPAFTGYLAEGQRNAIVKMTDKKVWGYWFWENLWGNLRWSRDPIERDNIMYSGYFGVMIGLYEALNDDRRFEQPGSLALRWNEGRRFDYDFGRLTGVLRRNMLRDPYSQYACEPNWIYPYCNTYGVNTVMLHDQIHGGSLSTEVVDRVRDSYSSGDFLRPDGRIIFVKSKFGPAFLPTSTAGDGMMAFWLHAGLPELADRTYWIMRNDLMRDLDSKPSLRLTVWDRIDPGRYTIGKGIYAWTSLLLAAREMGDDATAEVLQKAIDARVPVVRHNGARLYGKVSNFTNVTYALARFTRSHAMADLIQTGPPPEWQSGPILAEAAYPDVLVARAVTDGTSLDLVLRPGDGPRRTTLRLERLQPGRTYRLRGAVGDSVVAEADGSALIGVDLADRTAVHVSPE